jgi:hypothetical protein
VIESFKKRFDNAPLPYNAWLRGEIIMNSLRLTVTVLVVLMLAISSCNGGATPEPPATSGAPPTGTSSGQCVDFQGFQDNAKPGQMFNLGGFQFTALGPNDLFVNDATTNVHGLQFDPDGIQIDLPSLASTVTLMAGSFTSEPLEITALDGGGNVIAQTTIPADNSVHTDTLSGQGITSVVITGGGFEGVLVEICLTA